MSDRLDELAMRRRSLLLRSERLRAELAADQRVLLQALGGVDRAISTARRAAQPLLFLGLGAFALRFFRRRRPAKGSGFAVKALFWISMARRFLPYVSVLRSFLRSRSSRRYAESPARYDQ